MLNRNNIFKIYFVIIHLIVIVMLVKSNFISYVDRKLSGQAEISDHYVNMLSYHLMMDQSVPDRAIIFIGDSIIQGLCVADVTGKGINYGIGGDTTVGVLNRISFYSSIKRAEAVVLAIGVNDIHVVRRRDSEILDNFKKIIAEMPRDTPLIISAVLPVDENKFHKCINKRIVRLNEGIKKLCSITSNCYFIDSGGKLIINNGNLFYEYHVGDGIHLNRSGYLIWIGDLKKALFALNMGKAY